MKYSGIEWIGDIPKEWGVSRVKNHYTIISGSGFKPEFQGHSNGDYPVCKASDISNAGKELNTAANYITKQIANSEGFSIIPKGSLLFAKIGEAMKKNNRTITSVDCCVDNNCQGLVPKNINIGFGFYLFKCIDMEWFDNAGTIPCINNQKLLAFFLPLPPLPEQQKIADYLDRQCAQIDAVLTKTKQSIEEYKKLKNAIITHAVTKGIRQNRNFKYSNIQWIGDIPSEWGVGKIFYCFNLIGSGTTPTSNREDYYSGDINWLQSGDINGNIVNETSKTITQTALNDFQTLKIYKSPFLVIAMYGASIANTSIVNIDCTTNQACCVLSEPKENVNLKFTFYMILASKSELLLASRGGTQPNISQEIIKNYRLPLPPLPEQQEIADYLDTKCAQIDTLIGKKERLLGELEAYKKSLIYECVTGKREAE